MMRAALYASIIAALGAVGVVSLPSPSEDPIHSPLKDNTINDLEAAPLVSKYGTVYKVAAPDTNPLGGSLRYVENSGECGVLPS